MKFLRSNSVASSTSTCSQYSSSSCMSVKDYSNKISDLEQENFDLKLRLYLLEEKLNKVIKNQGEDQEDIMTQLDKTKESLLRCIELVEETVDQIELLETELINQKIKYEDRLVDTILRFTESDEEHEQDEVVDYLREIVEDDIYSLSSHDPSETGTNIDDVRTNEALGIDSSKQEFKKLQESDNPTVALRDIEDQVQFYRILTGRFQQRLLSLEDCWEEFLRHQRCIVCQRVSNNKEEENNIFKRVQELLNIESIYDE